MSGGVGPTCNDISLPKENEYRFKEQEDPKSSKTNTTQDPNPTTKNKSGFLSFRQLNCLAVIIVLSASGLVCLEDFAFVFFSFFYMYFISKFSFPPINPSKEPTVFKPNKLLKLYVLVGAIIGLYFPIAYILEGIIEGDKQGIKAASPHVFLLASQVFMEGVAFSPGFSIPIRVFVPVCYNSKRIFTISEWLRTEFYKVDQEFGGSQRRVYAGRGLAIANMAFWGFNLFGFLIPVYIPKAFKIYYSAYKSSD